MIHIVVDRLMQCNHRINRSMASIETRETQSEEAHSTTHSFTEPHPGTRLRAGPCRYPSAWVVESTWSSNFVPGKPVNSAI